MSSRHVGLRLLTSLMVWLCTTGGASRAGEQEFKLAGGHVAYGFGFATGSRPISLRHNLDVGLRVGWLKRTPSTIGMWSTGEGWLLGASCSSGLAAYRTFVLAEAGYGWDASLLGVSLMVGPAIEAYPDPRAGAGLRVAADAWLFQIGLRAIAVAGDETEVQLTLTLGFGRF